jgi:hypothetical protein
MSIVYAREDNLGADEYIAVVKSSGLNRPVEDRARVEQMLAQANLIVTAREDGRLVGFAPAPSPTSASAAISATLRSTRTARARESASG